MVAATKHTGLLGWNEVKKMPMKIPTEWDLGDNSVELCKLEDLSSNPQHPCFVVVFFFKCDYLCAPSELWGQQHDR